MGKFNSVHVPDVDDSSRSIAVQHIINRHVYRVEVYDKGPDSDPIIVRVSEQDFNDYVREMT